MQTFKPPIFICPEDFNTRVIVNRLCALIPQTRSAFTACRSAFTACRSRRSTSLAVAVCGWNGGGQRTLASAYVRQPDQGVQFYIELLVNIKRSNIVNQDRIAIHVAMSNEFDRLAISRVIVGVCLHGERSKQPNHTIYSKQVVVSR